MNQSLELMRKRHAYYTRLITDNDIHTAQEFYDRFTEQFMLIGTQLSMNNGNCDIYIECDGYDYEYYTIIDGESDGFASVSPVVAFKTWCTNLDANIFEINHLDGAFFGCDMTSDLRSKIENGKKKHQNETRQKFIESLTPKHSSLPDELVSELLTAKEIYYNRYESRTTAGSDRVRYISDLLDHRDYYPNCKTHLCNGDEFVCLIYTSSEHPIKDYERIRLKACYYFYLQGLNVSRLTIYMSDDDMGREMVLKHLCIKK